MSKQDFYQTLGVDREADEKSLKSAFRKKAMACHPDRHPDDPEAEARFKELFFFTSVDRFWEVMKVNLGGVVNCCKAAIPMLGKRRAGRIVNVASIAANIAVGPWRWPFPRLTS